MVAFATSHCLTTNHFLGVLPPIERLQGKLSQIALPQIDLPQIDLPQIDLPQISVADSLSSLGAFANQLQTVIAAALTHPFWAIGVVIVSIGLLQLIADLVKRILKAGIKLTLTLPLTVSQWLWKRATRPWKQSSDQKSIDQTSLDDTSKIAQLISRLDELRTEQDQVVDELKTLLNTSSSLSGHAKQSSLSEAVASSVPQSSAEGPES